MTDEPKISVREFERSISGLSQQVAEVAKTTDKILLEAQKTNGRVTLLETRMAAIEKSGVVTLREVWLVVATISATTAVLAAAVKWLPVFHRAAEGLRP